MAVTNHFFVLCIGIGLAVINSISVKGISLKNDAVLSENAQIVEMSDIIISMKNSKLEHRKRAVANTTEELHLNVFVLADYSLFKTWLSLYGNQVVKTILNMRYYFAHVINGVNDKFSTINTGPYRYKVSLAGFYISQSLQTSAFTEDDNVKTNESNVIQYVVVVRNLVQWVDNNTAILPKFGFVTAFTNYADQSATAMAYLARACTKRAVAIIKGGMMYPTANAVAHEIGHILGANHDGENNTCDKKENFLMAPVQVVDEVTNYHTFSSCSRTYFAEYVNYLNNSMRQSCFIKITSSEDKNVKTYLQNLPGQIFTPDQECQNQMGKNSFYCSPGAKANQEICKRLSCYDATKKACLTSADYRGLDGTPCGNKSWCINKECVYDSKAPIKNDYCMYGESKDPINFNDVLTYCSDVLKKPNLCYYDFFEEICCKSCLSLANPKDNQCKYGDRDQPLRYNSAAVTCEDFKNVTGYCYIESFRNVCCKTCSDIKTKNKPECPYGDNLYRIKYEDEILTCEDLKSYKFLCYDSIKTKCCKTCAELGKKNGNK